MLTTNSLVALILAQVSGEVTETAMIESPFSVSRDDERGITINGNRDGGTTDL